MSGIIHVKQWARFPQKFLGTSGPAGWPTLSWCLEFKDGSGSVATDSIGSADMTFENVGSAAWGSDYYDGIFTSGAPAGSRGYTPNGSFYNLTHFRWFKWIWLTAAPVASNSWGCIGNGTAYTAANYSVLFHAATAGGARLDFFISDGVTSTAVAGTGYDFTLNTEKWIFIGGSYERIGGAADNKSTVYINDGTTEVYVAKTDARLMQQINTFEIRTAPADDRGQSIRQGFTGIAEVTGATVQADWQAAYNWGRGNPW